MYWKTKPVDPTYDERNWCYRHACEKIPLFTTLYCPRCSEEKDLKRDLDKIVEDMELELTEPFSSVKKR